jgi:hypothetical protein
VFSYILVDTAEDAFNDDGTAKTQHQDNFVYEAGQMKRTSHSETDFSEYDNRGDAHHTETSTYKVEGNTLTLINFTVSDGRVFDANHNVSNQMVKTYSDKNSDRNKPLDVKEFRSLGFSPQGVALTQIVVTYSDLAKTKQMGVTETVNLEISASGNVGKRVVTEYGSVTYENGDSAQDILSYDNPQTRQTITTSQFDKRGNAVKQTILTEAKCPACL